MTRNMSLVFSQFWPAFCFMNPLIIMKYDMQVVIWWAGLMRGAVSMALAYNQVIKPLQLVYEYMTLTAGSFFAVQQLKQPWTAACSRECDNDHKHNNGCPFQHSGNY